MKTYIAVDIGGTQLRAACYPADSKTPLKLNKISTQHPSATPLERLMELITSVWPADGTVEAISVAIPGPVDPYAGIVRTTPNIPAWENLPLQKLVEGKFNVCVLLGNDANLAALAEWKYGAGVGHHDLIYMTISTGIGGGVIVGDRLLLGVHGLGAELGHVTVIPDGPVCSCGKRGHLEAVASGPGIARWTEEQLQNGTPSMLKPGQGLTAKMIGEAAQAGDGLAIQAFARAGTLIGHTIADYLHIFNPSLLIIGGGVSNTGDLLLEPMRKAIREGVCTPSFLEDFRLVTAVLRDEVGLIGALVLAQMSAAAG